MHGITARSEPKPDLQSFLAEAKAFAAGPYAAALQKGDALGDAGEAVGRAANVSADRPFARLHPAVEPPGAARTASSASCCAIGARSSAESIRAIVGTEADAAASRRATTRRRARFPARSSERSTTICSATSATRRRSPTGRTITPASANDWNIPAQRARRAAIRRQHQRRPRPGDARESAIEDS